MQYLSRFPVLEPGDVVELAIDGLGTQRQRIASPRITSRAGIDRSSDSTSAPVAGRSVAIAPPERPPVGLQLYTVRDDLAEDPRGTLRRVAELGLRVVEPFDLVAIADRLQEPMAEFGLSAPTSHVSFIHGGLDAALDAAARLGVRTIIDPYVPEEHWTTREDVAAVALALNDAARRADDHGIAVGYHNHWWELATRIDGTSALEILADRLDDAVVLELDTYWCAVGGEDPVALLGRLGERVVAVHVKDGPISRDVMTQLPAGSGRMPTAAILAAAPRARPILEFDAYAGDLYEGIARAIAFMRQHAAAL